MEVVRRGPHVAVPSTVTRGKWWVFNENKGDMYAIGIVYNMSGDFVANRVERIEGRLRSYFLGEAESIQGALILFREH